MKAKAAPDQKPLVIVVDDSVSILNSTKRLIRSFGFRPESFASANEFFGSELINECACLILDVRMPCVDGLELQRRLAETHPHIPIVFFTAHGSNEEQERAMTAGAVAFLRKPVTSEVLFHAIQNASGLRASILSWACFFSTWWDARLVTGQMKKSPLAKER